MNTGLAGEDIAFGVVIYVGKMPETTATRVKQIDRKVRVLIADDQPVIRRLVRSTLQQHPHFEVCGEATDGAEAVEEARKLKPDVVVLNVTMPFLNGFQAAREIRKSVPNSAIVILSSNADRAFVDLARSIGVRGYLSKSRAGEGLIKAVETAALGEDFTLVD